MSSPLDHDALEAWYRDALRVRVHELEALLEPLRSGGRESAGQARDLGRSLRGSGGSFGFPAISDAAEILEGAPDADALRCAEGLVVLLRKTAWPDDTAEHRPMDWLARVLDLRPRSLPYPADTATAWSRGAEEAAVDVHEVAERVADAFALAIADTTAAGRMAIRLVPEALVRRHRILPLTEDGVSIEVATDNPTDLTAELAIRHVTGRRVVFRIAPPDELREALKHLPSASSPEAPGSDEAHSAVAGTTVLLVDDDEEARLLVRALLEGKGGFRILEASDGEEGLERLDRDDSIHLVVVDLSMPRMGGREMLRALRALPLRTQPSVIVVTGAGDPRLEADLIEDGADDYIRKPLDPRLFLARVTATLRRAGI